MGSLWGQKINAISKYIGSHLVSRLVRILVLAAGIGAIAVAHDLRDGGIWNAAIDECRCDVMAHGVDPEHVQAGTGLEPA